MKKFILIAISMASLAAFSQSTCNFAFEKTGKSISLIKSVQSSNSILFKVKVVNGTRNSYEATYAANKIEKIGVYGGTFILTKIQDESTWKDMPNLLTWKEVHFRLSEYTLDGLSSKFSFIVGPLKTYNPTSCDSSN